MSETLLSEDIAILTRTPKVVNELLWSAYLSILRR